MLEAKDLVSLFTGVNLGILAAALTLIAIYPAVIGFLKNTAISSILDNEKQRRSLFRWLATTACASWLGLSLMLSFVLFDYLDRNLLAASPYQWLAQGAKIYMFRISAVSTFLGIAAIARGGWVIVRMTLRAQ